MTKAEDAATQAAAGLLTSDEAEPEASSVEEQPDEPDQGTQEAAFEMPSYEAEVPEDVLLELEAEEDVFTQEDEGEQEYQYEYQQDNRVEIERLKKERDYYKNLRVQSSRKQWEEEAKKFFPLSENVLDQINADSRRSFLRQAKAAHETVLPFVKSYADKANEAIEQVKEQARAEAREEAKKAWGQPTVEGDQGVPTDAETRVQMERARARGDFGDVVKAMLFPKGGSDAARQ